MACTPVIIGDAWEAIWCEGVWVDNVWEAGPAATLLRSNQRLFSRLSGFHFPNRNRLSASESVEFFPFPPVLQKISAAPTATITGSILSATDEDDIVTGGKQIIINLQNDTWETIGFDLQRQAIIDGLDAALNPTTGWNNEVRDKEVVTAVVRTDDTTVTITLSAASAYNISSQEVITVTVPAAALVTSVSDITATPTFTVDPVAVEKAPVLPHPLRQRLQYNRFLRPSEYDYQSRSEHVQTVVPPPVTAQPILVSPLRKLVSHHFVQKPAEFDYGTRPENIVTVVPPPVEKQPTLVNPLRRLSMQHFVQKPEEFDYATRPLFIGLPTRAKAKAPILVNPLRSRISPHFLPRRVFQKRFQRTLQTVAPPIPAATMLRHSVRPFRPNLQR